MKQSSLIILTFLIAFTFLFACSKVEEEIESNIKEGTGIVWLSGGLMFCAEQIRMENGDTLIPVNNFEVLKFSSGQQVNIRFIEIKERESACSIGLDCEIIEISKAE